MARLLQDEDDEERQDDVFAVNEWRTWKPEPVTVDIEKPKRAKQMYNIIAMLILIYGSRDLFINDYRFCPPSTLS